MLNLPAQRRHDRLKVAITRLLRRPSGRIALDEKKVVRPRVVRRAIGQLAGQSGPGSPFLRTTLRPARCRAWAALMARSAIAHRYPCAGSATVRTRPDDTSDEWRTFARRQPLLCLTRELRIEQKLHRQYVADVIPASSGASLTPRGNRFRNSQNSRTASVSPLRRPLTWVPPWGVRIRLT